MSRTYKDRRREERHREREERAWVEAHAEEERMRQDWEASREDREVRGFDLWKFALQGGR